MHPDHARWQRVFTRASLRTQDMSDEWLRHLELSLARSFVFVGPKPPMVRELVRAMEAEPPGSAFRQRVEHTLRRAHSRLMRGGRRPEELEIAVNAWLDGQIDTASRTLTADIALRPWGEP